MNLKKVKTQKYKAMKMKCRERGGGGKQSREEKGGETGLTEMRKKSESYRSNIKEGKRNDE